MKLTTPMQITAADSDARTITGRIVAFNEHANAAQARLFLPVDQLLSMMCFLI
jgi:hypothetical protein